MSATGRGGRLGARLKLRNLRAPAVRASPQLRGAPATRTKPPRLAAIRPNPNAIPASRPSRGQPQSTGRTPWARWARTGGHRRRRPAIRPLRGSGSRWNWPGRRSQAEGSRIAWSGRKIGPGGRATSCRPAIVVLIRGTWPQGQARPVDMVAVRRRGGAPAAAEGRSDRVAPARRFLATQAPPEPRF